MTIDLILNVPWLSIVRFKVIESTMLDEKKGQPGVQRGWPVKRDNGDYNTNDITVQVAKQHLQAQSLLYVCIFER